MKSNSRPLRQPSRAPFEMIEYTERNAAGSVVSRETIVSGGVDRPVSVRASFPSAGAVGSVLSDVPLLNRRAVGALPSGGGRVSASPRSATVDPNVLRALAVSDALSHRLDPNLPLTDIGRQYRHMSVLEMGRSYLEGVGRSTAGMDRFRLSQELMQYRSGSSGTTSDFVAILSNVALKRLRAAYEENLPTYQLWAVRAPNAPNFKDLNVVQLSGAPELLLTREHGNFKYGTMEAQGETYKLINFGRIISLSRQALINDDLGAFSRAISSFGASARRLENRLVYSQLMGNAALADGLPLYHASRGNSASGIGSALQASSLATARTAMRMQKGLQSEQLNIMPKYLIVPSTLEQIAYQLTASNFVPAKSADTAEFGSSGRTPLTPIVDAVLDTISVAGWYLASNGSMVDTVEYCYLEGSDGPVLDAKDDFDVDATSFRCKHDFAAKAIDYRGLYRGAGI